MKRICRYQPGFTFLEVMIAVAILAIALVALLRLVVLGVHNADYDKTMTLATLLAREKISEGLLLTGAERNGGGQGEHEFSDYSWERTVTATVFNRIEQITVTVKWVEGEEERNVVLTQFIFQG
ncbi:type II secretion system minor pseudopilin GspI [bacterium]|nr:type II secretion system minor pseudopilin GspI [bacterium]